MTDILIVEGMARYNQCWVCCRIENCGLYNPFKRSYSERAATTTCLSISLDRKIVIVWRVWETRSLIENYKYLHDTVVNLTTLSKRLFELQ